MGYGVLPEHICYNPVEKSVDLVEKLSFAKEKSEDCAHRASDLAGVC